MMTLEKMTIAISFSNPDKAGKFAKDFKQSFQGADFIINYGNFDLFIKELSNHQQIDCFMVDENFKTCSPVDLMRKIKRSQKYKKTYTVMETNDINSIDSEISGLRLDLLYDYAFSSQELCETIINGIKLKQAPVIPKDYNVLVLDNDETILETMSIFLNQLDHEHFDICMSVKNAKEKLLENRYDFLMLDWNLDDGTCLELIEFIKTNEQTKKLENDKALTMVITGRDDVEDIMTLLQYGVKDQIIKPFNFDEFEDKVMYALKKHKR